VANLCWSFFEAYGNKRVKDQISKWRELLFRSSAPDAKQNKFSTIAALFYEGRSQSEIDLGASWVEFDSESLGDKGITFLSSWIPPDHLQDTITILLSKLDRKVVVKNSFHDESGAIGFRYSTVESENAIYSQSARVDRDDLDSDGEFSEECVSKLLELEAEILYNFLDDYPDRAVKLKKQLAHLDIAWEDFQ